MRARLREPRAERLPFNVLNRHEDAVAEGPDVVDHEHVRVPEPGHRLRLAQEPRVRLLAAHVEAQDLDRDRRASCAS
jgi:hypothetical protein